jgi:hypothetical protein
LRNGLEVKSLGERAPLTVAERSFMSPPLVAAAPIAAVFVERPRRVRLWQDGRARLRTEARRVPGRARGHRPRR